jgi:hypothetical protein
MCGAGTTRCYLPCFTSSAASYSAHGWCTLHKICRRCQSLNTSDIVTLCRSYWTLLSETTPLPVKAAALGAVLVAVCCCRDNVPVAHRSGTGLWIVLVLWFKTIAVGVSKVSTTSLITPQRLTPPSEAEEKQGQIRLMHQRFQPSSSALTPLCPTNTCKLFASRRETVHIFFYSKARALENYCLQMRLVTLLPTKFPIPGADGSSKAFDERDRV